jgi:hypothetical protein
VTSIFQPLKPPRLIIVSPSFDPCSSQDNASADSGASLSTCDLIPATTLMVQGEIHKPGGLLPSVGFALQRDNFGIFSERDAFNIFQPSVKLTNVFVLALQRMPRQPAQVSEL